MTSYGFVKPPGGGNSNIFGGEEAKPDPENFTNRARINQQNSSDMNSVIGTVDANDVLRETSAENINHSPDHIPELDTRAKYGPEAADYAKQSDWKPPDGGTSNISGGGEEPEPENSEPHNFTNRARSNQQNSSGMSSCMGTVDANDVLRETSAENINHSPDQIPEQGARATYAADPDLPRTNGPGAGGRVFGF